MSIGREKVLQLPSTWLHRTLLQLACLCQALYLVSLESLRRNHTRLSQPPCRTTSATMFALRTERFTAHFKVIVASVPTRMSGVRLIRETVRPKRVPKCDKQRLRVHFRQLSDAE